MMIVLLAEHASTNVLLRQYQKATSIKLIPMYALTVVHVRMFVLLRLFIRHSITIQENGTGTFESMSLFIFISGCILLSQGYPEHLYSLSYPPFLIPDSLSYMIR